jgi:hypothetical protein
MSVWEILSSFAQRTNTQTRKYILAVKMSSNE